MTSTVRPKTLLECDALAKVFTRNFELGRRHVFSDIFRLRARSLDRLRPEEWVAVRGFSITIHEGENVLVLGMAGSGKTTIAKLLTGMLRADGGRVCLGGRVGLIGGRAVGMVAFLTVWECVQLATGIHGVEPEVADACCEEVLEITGLSGERDTKLIDLPKECGGQLGLVSALVVPKDLRIFDGLPRVGDDPVSRRVAARVGQVLDQGANLILSSTTAGLPDNLSRAMILHDGEILYEGSSQMVVPVYNKFIYRINRLDEMQSQPLEAGSVTPDVREALTPGEVIRRSVRSVERTSAVSDVAHHVAQAWNSHRPIIVGPYLSDVGLELLYWRPFVSWVYSRFGTPSQPVVAVSRGRVGEWYTGLVSSYVDVCDVVPFGDFEDRNRGRIQQAGSWKQKEVSSFDDELLDLVARRIGASDYAVVHPSLLFNACSRVWNGSLPGSWLLEHSRYERLMPPLPTEPSTSETESEPYMALGFRFSASFGDTGPNRDLMNRVMVELSGRMTVKLVDSAGFIPEAALASRLNDIPVVPPPDRAEGQLREQAAIVAGAQAYIGTFGSISLLAPFYNVPTLMVFEEEGKLFSHHVKVLRSAAETVTDVCVDVEKANELTPTRLGAWLDQVLS